MYVGQEKTSEKNSDFEIFVVDPYKMSSRFLQTFHFFSSSFWSEILNY